MTVAMADLASGDRVNAFVWTGGETSGLIYLTVVRVNRTTVTVRYADGHTQRINPHDLNGKLSETEFELVAEVDQGGPKHKPG